MVIINVSSEWVLVAIKRIMELVVNESSKPQGSALLKTEVTYNRPNLHMIWILHSVQVIIYNTVNSHAWLLIIGNMITKE